MEGSRRFRRRKLLATLVLACGAISGFQSASAQYLGVTVGYSYDNELTGPETNTTSQNISLYNPDPNHPEKTWGVWAAQLAEAGVDYAAPNLNGSTPMTLHPPTQIAPFVAAINAMGLTDPPKLAIFDDNAASWTAQYNLALGNGFDYQVPFDLSNPTNWQYIYDFNYKLFYQTVPAQNLFMINGRPLILIWGGGAGLLANEQGNLSRALLYVRQSAMADFGYDPIIIIPNELQNDTTLSAPGVIDGIQTWFTPEPV
jgi:hypothetical protein